jgi:hypothetical protein
MRWGGISVTAALWAAALTGVALAEDHALRLGVAAIAVGLGGLKARDDLRRRRSQAGIMAALREHEDQLAAFERAWEAIGAARQPGGRPALRVVQGASPAAVPEPGPAASRSPR